MPVMPLPQPPLDGVPPSPPGVPAGGGANPPLQQMTPSASLSGSMQVVQICIQAASEAAKLIDLIGQVNPGFAPTAAMIIEQLRGGLKSTLQQGAAPSEPSAQMPSASMPSQAPTQGAVQQPLPPMGAGMGMGQ